MEIQAQLNEAHRIDTIIANESDASVSQCSDPIRRASWIRYDNVDRQKRKSNNYKPDFFSIRSVSVFVSKFAHTQTHTNIL